MTSSNGNTTTRSISATDPLVKLGVLETNIGTIASEGDVVMLCHKMCEYAKEDGLSLINVDNPSLCKRTCDYYSQQTQHMSLSRQGQKER